MQLSVIIDFFQERAKTIVYTKNTVYNIDIYVFFMDGTCKMISGVLSVPLRRLNDSSFKKLVCRQAVQKFFNAVTPAKVGPVIPNRRLRLRGNDETMDI
jgi:hypothetical protein